MHQEGSLSSKRRKKEAGNLWQHPAHRHEYYQEHYLERPKALGRRGPIAFTIFFVKVPVLSMAACCISERIWRSVKLKLRSGPYDSVEDLEVCTFAYARCHIRIWIPEMLHWKKTSRPWFLLMGAKNDCYVNVPQSSEGWQCLAPMTLDNLSKSKFCWNIQKPS